MVSLDELNAVLNERLTQQQQILDKQMTNIFIGGLISGVVFSHTGVVGFCTGAVSGLLLSKLINRLDDVLPVLFSRMNSQAFMEYARSLVEQNSSGVCVENPVSQKCG